MNEAFPAEQIEGLTLLHRGKVRDIYGVDASRLLIVTTDRISAFDVVLPTPIPGKGALLTEISNFWFARTRHIVANHLLALDLDRLVPDPAQRARLARRTVLVRRLAPLPIEAIVRGYLVGSGYADYRRSGTVCGIALPSGLAQAAQLPEPIFTPSTKAAVGEHDQNIGFDAAVALLGAERAEHVRELSLALYRHAAEYAAARGIIIADTKFEFGVDEKGEIVLIDEALTPDSSRFWPADEYRTGVNPPSFDKQYVRDYLESLDWDKRPPGPELPVDVAEKTAAKYREALRRLID